MLLLFFAFTNAQFHLQLQCNVTPTKCNNAERAFNQATSILSSLIHFSSPINIRAYYSPCTKCTESEPILARGGPTNFHHVNNDTAWLYPQALAKQLVTNGTWSEFDINVYVYAYDIQQNDDIIDRFWIDGPISPVQFDLHYVLLHELIHGLGFLTSLGMYFIDDTGVTLELITPPVGMNGFTEMYIFDKFIRVNGESVVDWVEKIKQQGNGKDNIRLEEMPTAHELYNSAIREKALTFNSENIYLETQYNPFDSGSSISHLDFAVYDNTPNFLMRSK